MKKSLLASAMAAAVVLSTSVAMAAPGDITVDGNAYYQYRNNSGSTAAGDKRINKTAVFLNVKGDLGGNWSVYSQFAAQGANGGKDFQSDVYTNDKEFAAGLNQFGFQYTGDTSTVKIGRQDLILGSGLFYDITGKLGRHSLLDGVTWTGKADALSYQVVAAQEDRSRGDGQASKNKMYAAHVDYAATPDFTVGATYANYKYKDSSFKLGDKQTVNAYAMNLGYSFGAANVFAEYGKTNNSNDNKAYQYGVGYQFDDKNKASATYYKVEALGDLNGNTTFDTGEKGMYYSYTHTFTKAVNVNVFYKDSKNVKNDNIKDKSFRATVNYNF
ncbi:MAG: porin [Sporomusaceae bacterium]|nr:porin [Sporomusaceae bacterium]